MQRFLITTYTLCCLAGLSAQADGQLQDTSQRIKDGFPKSDGHRVVVCAMTSRRHERVVRELPFTLHFSEDHTVLVPVRASRPLGIVHVRSESGEWGLVEIVWYLDMDLKIRDFSFQRCRSRARQQVGSREFRRQLAGKSLEQLLPLLSEDCLSLQPKALEVATRSQSLAVIVVRSALKTILATRYAWGEDGELSDVLSAIQRVFPQARRFDCIDGLYSRDRQTVLRKHLGSYGGKAIERRTAWLFKAYNETGRSVGAVFRGDWRGSQHVTRLWWKLSPDRRVAAVIPDGKWPSLPLERAFQNLRGMSVADAPRSVTESQLVTAEVLVVTDPHLKTLNVASPR